MEDCEKANFIARACPRTFRPLRSRSNCWHCIKPSDKRRRCKWIRCWHVWHALSPNAATHAKLNLGGSGSCCRLFPP